MEWNTSIIAVIVGVACHKRHTALVDVSSCLIVCLNVASHIHTHTHTHKRIYTLAFIVDVMVCVSCGPWAGLNIYRGLCRVAISFTFNETSRVESNLVRGINSNRQADWQPSHTIRHTDEMEMEMDTRPGWLSWQMDRQIDKATGTIWVTILLFSCCNYFCCILLQLVACKQRVQNV